MGVRSTSSASASGPAARSSQRSSTVLVIEDSPTDARLIRDTLERSARPVDVVVVRDGRAALDLLTPSADQEAEIRPDLVLLDLDVPGGSGHEVLAQVKSDPATRAVAVVVLTSSRDDTDIQRAYQHHANSYVVKPTDAQAFAAAVTAVVSYWLDVDAGPGP